MRAARALGRGGATSSESPPNQADAVLFFVAASAYHRDLHGTKHSFPTRRSSDLAPAPGRESCGRRSRSAIARARSWWARAGGRSEEHTSELQSLRTISYAVFCLKKKKKKKYIENNKKKKYYE